MAMYQIHCRTCSHDFYRVEVRCQDYPTTYDCPACEGKDTTKKFIQPKNDQIAAEDKPCCKEKSQCKK